LTSLIEPGRVVLLVQRYDGGMARGGFYTLMLWEPGFGVMPMIGALEAIGAKQTAQVLGTLALLFPEGTIPDDAQLRRRQFEDQVMSREQELDRLAEALRAAEASENITALSLAYARSHATELLMEELEPSASADGPSTTL